MYIYRGLSPEGELSRSFASQKKLQPKEGDGKVDVTRERKGSIKEIGIEVESKTASHFSRGHRLFMDHQTGLGRRESKGKSFATDLVENCRYILHF
jgi:hypothetical protein